MNTNNFDQSSSGLNLELSCFYDTDLARFYFDETFHILQHSSYGENAIYIYGANCQNVSDFSLSDLDNYVIPNKSELYNLIVSEVYCGDRENFNDDANSYFSRTSSKLTKSELLELLDNVISSEDLKDFFYDNFDHKFAMIESRGYCQGDYVQVIIPEAICGEFTDQTLETIGDFLQDEIDHLIWNCPVYCRLMINDVEIDLSELLEDLYSWDKEIILSKFSDIIPDQYKDKKEIIYAFLVDNLPENPDYI